MSKTGDGETGSRGKGRGTGDSPSAGEDRQTRLARQLRANLKKRKDQQRRRKAPDGGGERGGGDGR